MAGEAGIEDTSNSWHDGERNRDNPMDNLKRNASYTKSALTITFTLTMIINLVDAFAGPSGDIWEAVRIVATALFTASLIAFTVSQLRRRAKRRHAE
jgi:hypothetical protein